ncbi:MAG: serine acetyltransferase [Coriobacteriia bacterium]|nr:serine acetyltransferase [Coriobacteriia bacterium]
MFNEKLDEIVERIEENYNDEIIAFNDVDRHFPNKGAIIQIILDLRRVMFPRYFGDEAPCGAGPKYFIGDTLTRVEEALHREVFEALMFRDRKKMTRDEIEARTSQICSDFFYKLPEIQQLLLKDVQAAYDGDPAAGSKAEIIYCYPGFFAIFVYRLAHELALHDVPLVPRIMSEYAHTETGVDIGAKAEIGEYFFIDHAVGVVIGETTTIGNHVKIYQGVTLGALSTRGGQSLAGVKRHPTVEDNVTIYSNASVLGGETVVGAHSVIGGSAFVTESVPPHSRVSLANQEVSVRVREPKPGEFEI